jgi:predicted nucleic acid-binding protein
MPPAAPQPSPGAAPAATSPHTVVIDTSVWISRLVRTDSNHARARAWLDTFIQGGGTLIAPALFATEVGANISRITGKPLRGRAAVRQLYALPLLTLVPMDQALVDEATDTGIDYALKASDAFFVAIARRLNIPLVTFDHDQLTRASIIITAIRP